MLPLAGRAALAAAASSPRRDAMGALVLTVERLAGSGAYRIAAMVGGYRVERCYYGCGRAYAVRQFRAYVREELGGAR